MLLYLCIDLSVLEQLEQGSCFILAVHIPQMLHVPASVLF